jgi:hypothetical protein
LQEKPEEACILGTEKADSENEEGSIMEDTVRHCRELVDEIKSLSARYPNESRYIMESILQQNAIPAYEVEALVRGEGERSRFKVIMNSLREIKRELLKLSGNRIYDKVPAKYDPLKMPVVLVNKPNIERTPQIKYVPTKRDVSEKKKAISTPGFWRK